MHSIIMSQTDRQTDRWAGIDICKFLMAIFVIAIHTHPVAQEGTGYYFYQGTVALAVPFFFIASGFMLGLHINFEDKQSIQNNLAAYGKKIFLLYCKWSLYYLPLAIMEYTKRGSTLIRSILSYIRGFLFVGEHYNSWHLWYLLSLCISIVLIYLMYLLSISFRNMIFISAFIYLAAVSITYLITLDTNNLVLMLYEKIFGTGRLWTGLLYVTIGLYWSKHKIVIYKPIAVLLVLVGIFGKFFFYHISPAADIFTAVGAVALFDICSNIRLNAILNFKIFRKMSTYMYFMHMYIWTFYTYIILRKPDKYGLDSFLFTTIVSILIAFMIY